MGYGAVPGLQAIAGRSPRNSLTKDARIDIPERSLSERTALLNSWRARNQQTPLRDWWNWKTEFLAFFAIAGLMIGIHLLVHDAAGWPVNYPFFLVSRETWYRGEPIEKFNITALNGSLVTNLVMFHTRGDYCYDINTCLRVISKIGSKNISEVPYNFLIGGDGKTYELRGWNYMSGFKDLPANNRSITVGLIGDFTWVEPSPLQNAEITALITESIRSGNMAKDYTIHGAKLEENEAQMMFKMLESFENFVGRIFEL